jgi:uncharacterized protein
MIAVDTNILVYAHRADSPWHDGALAKITELAEGRSPWTIPWPCIHEFLAIVTHPRVYSPPTPLAAAIDQVEAWLESPSLMLIAETEGYWRELRLRSNKGGSAGRRSTTPVSRRYAGIIEYASCGLRIAISVVSLALMS